MGPANSGKQLILFSTPFVFAVFAGVFMPRLGVTLFLALFFSLIGGGLVIFLKMRVRNLRGTAFSWGVKGLSKVEHLLYIIGWVSLIVSIVLTLIGIAE